MRGETLSKEKGGRTGVRGEGIKRWERKKGEEEREGKNILI